MHGAHDGHYDCDIWEILKSRGTLLWGPYNKDPTI